jgi:hypothetical protein
VAQHVDRSDHQMSGVYRAPQSVPLLISVFITMLVFQEAIDQQWRRTCAGVYFGCELYTKLGLTSQCIQL